MKNRIPLVVFFTLVACMLKAQDDSVATVEDLKQLSLEDLMNISIFSVSKAEEATFEAPLSSTVITRAEIKKAGCTSIMEALRLVPGVIVREQTNGNYDIHIRGLDNIPPNLGMYFFTNATTLVMIDSRPVYNYVQGGTFWESLPIDLNDVEKIEVVRGPASAMYGPNAESGVINIITRKPEKEGVYVVANGQYGRYNTGIANASVGYQYKDKFSFIGSGNFQTRERTQRDYYVGSTDMFIPVDSFVTNDSMRKLQYPHPVLSMRKYGYNGFFNYRINDKASISVQGGGQHSEVQNMFASNFLTTAKSTTYYGNLKAEIYGANVQVSYLTGKQSPQSGIPASTWDFNTLDVVLDYNITQIKHLVITPGFSYRRAIYDDRKYIDEAARAGLFNAKVESNTISALLRADAKLFKEKMRLLAAARMDRFNAPKKLYFSWEFAVTYKVNDRHMLRIVESRANQAPLLLNNFYNLSVPFFVPSIGPGTIQLLGNTDLKLLTTDMLEVGYRGKVRDNLEIDIEIFGSSTKNFANQVFWNVDTSATGTDFLYRFENLPLIARQIGGTLSVTYVMGRFQFRPFITVQQTTLFNYSPYAVSPNAPETIFFSQNVDTNNYNSGIGTQMKHRATPAVFGGAYINIEIVKNLNLNLNPYFMSGGTQLEAANLSFGDGKRGVENIRAKFIMNIVASYTLFNKLTFFMNFKNCFSDKTREFYRGDIPGFKVSGGANFEF